MDTTLMKKAWEKAGLQHGETWYAWISRGNVPRMNDLRNGKPHTRKYDNTGRNIETTDSSIGYILNPGTKDGRDEQHAIWHLVRCLAVFGHGCVPITETSHSLREALDAEIAHCREIGLPHRAIADYKRALDDFMNVAYYTQTPYLNDADFLAELETKAQALVDARYALSVAADEEDHPVSAVVVGFSDDAKGLIRSEGDRVIRVIRNDTLKDKRQIIKAITDYRTDADEAGETTSDPRELQRAEVRRIIREAQAKGEHMSLHKACKLAWKPLKGGYPTYKHLYTYCNSHRNDFL